MTRGDWGILALLAAVVAILWIGVSSEISRIGYCTACCSGKGLQRLSVNDHACTCFPAAGGPVVAFRNEHCEAQ